jgi:hypothetical protein
MAGATRVTRPGPDFAISFAMPKAMARQLNITGPIIADATLAAVAASDDRDKLPSTRIKSICRGR